MRCIHCATKHQSEYITCAVLTLADVEASLQGHTF